MALVLVFIGLDLAGVLDDRSDKFPIRDSCPQHLGDRSLNEDTVFFTFNGQTDVDAATLSCGDFHSETLLRKVHLTRIRRVDLDRRSSASDLESKRGRVCHGYNGDDGLAKNRRLGAVRCGCNERASQRALMSNDEPRLIAFTLPFTWMVVFLHP